MIHVGSTYRLKHSMYSEDDDKYPYISEGEQARVIGMAMNNDTSHSAYTLEFENGLILSNLAYRSMLLSFEPVEER